LLIFVTEEHNNFFSDFFLSKKYFSLYFSREKKVELTREREKISTTNNAPHPLSSSSFTLSPPNKKREHVKTRGESLVRGETEKRRRTERKKKEKKR